jgi:hypothetical protein
MGEIIQLPDIISVRRRMAQSLARRENLECALEIIRLNVISVLTMLKGASPSERVELLERAERLIALLQYGTRILDEEPICTPRAPRARRDIEDSEPS